MTQEESLLWEIEKRGGSITTHELMTLGIMQYQARLKGLREKLALQGITLTEGQPIKGQKKNFLYKLVNPFVKSREAFSANPASETSPGMEGAKTAQGIFYKEKERTPWDFA